MIMVKRRSVFAAAIIIAAVFAVWGVMPRYRAETNNKTVSFISDYRDLVSLAMQSSSNQNKVWSSIHANGVEGLSVAEYTGEEITLLNPIPVKYDSASVFGIRDSSFQYDNAVIMVQNNISYLDKIIAYTKIKLPASKVIKEGNVTYIVLPGTREEFKMSALIPDFEALDFCRRNSISVLFRPAPCTPSNGRMVAAALDYLTTSYPEIKNIIPAGMIMAGNPDFDMMTEILKKKDITVSQVEFVKQVGVPQFVNEMRPNIIPLHSLTKDEIISRKHSQKQIVDRFVRAVHERSIRFIMVRPYDLQMGDRLEVFLSDLAIQKEALEARGYSFGFPVHFPVWPLSLPGALACSIFFVFCTWSYLSRLKNLQQNVSVGELALLCAASLILSAAFVKIPASAKILGGFCGALIALEAALTALDSKGRHIKGSLFSLFILIAGGLSIAAFYGTTPAALRLAPFSGVKLTLLLPPLLLLVHDLVRRVHPESISEIAARPAMWGELLLIGIMMAGLLVMALRSDNVANVPAAEIAFRDFMERTLVVRPRTKEFLIGYPALVVYWLLVKKNWFANYREAVRIVAVLAFCSAVNTFCHFHTLLTLSVVRVFNGWWLGMIIGIAAAAVIGYTAAFMAKKRTGVFSD